MQFLAFFFTRKLMLVTITKVIALSAIRLQLINLHLLTLNLPGYSH